MKNLENVNAVEAIPAKMNEAAKNMLADERNKPDKNELLEDLKKFESDLENTFDDSDIEKLEYTIKIIKSRLNIQ